MPRLSLLAVLLMASLACDPVVADTGSPLPAGWTGACPLRPSGRGPAETWHLAIQVVPDGDQVKGQFTAEGPDGWVLLGGVDGDRSADHLAMLLLDARDAPEQAFGVDGWLVDGVLDADVERAEGTEVVAHGLCRLEELE